MPSLKDRIRNGLDWIAPVVRGRMFWAGLAGLLVVFGVVYVTFNAALMPLYTRQGAAVVVPEVRELPFEEAVSVLRSRNLRAERRDQPFNPSVAREAVVDQNPLPNASVKPGRRIYLYVNSGAERSVSMPEVRTLAESLARARLAELGLTNLDVRTDDQPSPFLGTVTRQEPAPGATLRTGEQVVIWISPGRGEDSVEVPDVQGLSGEEAARVLSEAGLWVDPTLRLSGTVTRQEPAAGQSVRTGTEIRLSAAPIQTAPPPPEDEIVEIPLEEPPPDAGFFEEAPAEAPRDADRTDW